MMNHSSRCFNQPILKALTFGYYSEPLLNWYLSHLDHCDTCRARLLDFRQMEAEILGQTAAGQPQSTTDVALGDSSFDLPCLEQFGLEPPSSPEELARLGDFRVLRTIGRGQSSIIFEAEDLWLSRQVVLKLLHKDLASQMEGRLIFLAEAKAIAAIDHENVLPILNIGQEGDEFYLVMPMLAGESLKSALVSRKFSLTQALAITRQVAAGLAAIHKAGLLHCNLKPSNIWLQAMPDGTENAVILDFGFSALSSLRLRQRIQSDLAPEQISGGQVDTRTDIFSLGRLLLTLLHEQTDEYDIQAGATPPQPLFHHLAPIVPLLNRLLAHDPIDRPADADAVVQMINRLEQKSRRRWLMTTSTAASASLIALVYNQFRKVEKPTVSIQKSQPPRPELKSNPRQLLTNIQPNVIIPVGPHDVLAIDHTRQNLITARPDRSVIVQGISNESKPLLKFQCDFEPFKISLCSSGQLLAAASSDGQLMVWTLNQNASEAQLLFRSHFQMKKVQDLLWTDEPEPRVIMAEGKSISLINHARAPTKEDFHQTYQLDYPIQKIHVRPGHHELVIVVEDGGLLIWDLLTQSSKAGFRSFSDKSVLFASSTTGKSLGSSSREGILVRYDGQCHTPASPNLAQFWQAEYVSYFYKPSIGLTFVSDSVVLIQIEASALPSAQFLMLDLQKPDRECIMRFNNQNVVRMFNSADHPRLYCLNDKNELLACDLSSGIAQLAQPL